MVMVKPPKYAAFAIVGIVLLIGAFLYYQDYADRGEAQSFAMDIVDDFYTHDCDHFYNSLAGTIAWGLTPENTEDYSVYSKTDYPQSSWCGGTINLYAFSSLMTHDEYNTFVNNVWKPRVNSYSQYKTRFPEELSSWSDRDAWFLYVPYADYSEDGIIFYGYSFMVKKINDEWKITAWGYVLDEQTTPPSGSIISVPSGGPRIVIDGRNQHLQ